ncbi:MAG TPA: hypothetical protein VH643_07990 [Gemmataceae bacterium]|jgi:hypothetical protein
MSETKYSEFTLNFNPRFRRTDEQHPDERGQPEKKRPTLIGKAMVIDADGTATEFEVAAWGPNAARTGGPDYYSGTLNPKDPAWRARQLSTTIDGPVRNAIEGFELKQLGALRLFERTEADIQAAKANGKSLPRFYGHGLVLLPSGPRYVDLSAWYRPEHGFYSGNAPLHDPAAASAARAAKPAAEPA